MISSVRAIDDDIHRLEKVIMAAAERDRVFPAAAVHAFHDLAPQRPGTPLGDVTPTISCLAPLLRGTGVMPRRDLTPYTNPAIFDGCTCLSRHLLESERTTRHDLA